jgi:Protein of unknown function (DUF2917)
MILDMERVVIELAYREIVPVENAVGTRVDCLSGRIWITEQGCTDDIVLEAGESFELARGGVAVVQALREGFVAFRAPAVRQAEAALAARIERLWSRWTARAPCGHPVIAEPGAS